MIVSAKSSDIEMIVALLHSLVNGILSVKIISTREDLAEIGAVVTPEEKRKVVDKIHVQKFKENQSI